MKKRHGSAKPDESPTENELQNHEKFLVTFGQSVAKRRKYSSRSGHADLLPGGTQAELAEASGITLKELQRIERGEVKTIASYRYLVGKIASGLQLSEAEKASFFAEAGLNYAVRPQTDDLDTLKRHLAALQYPAAIRTPLWDFVAFNEYYKRFWDYSEARLEWLNEQPLGANLLKVVFDQRFLGALGDKHTSTQEQVVQSFRASAFPYIQTSRYETIVTAMRIYRAFEWQWQLSGRDYQELQPPYAVGRFERNRRTLTHPELGQLTFLSLRLPNIHQNEFFTISVYVPLGESQSKFTEYAKSVRANHVTAFPLVNLD